MPETILPPATGSERDAPRIEFNYLGHRTAEALSLAGIYFLDELKSLNRHELLAIKGIGKKGIEKIENYLAHKKLALR